MLVVHEEAHFLVKLLKLIFPFLFPCVILLSLSLPYYLQQLLGRAETLHG